MFRRIKLRIQDMRTLSKLISGADEQANLLGEDEPGAEHFLLSALELPDGSARRVFERLGLDAKQYQQAIKQQYVEALNNLGIQADILKADPEPVKPGRMLQQSKPSGQLLIRQLYEMKQKDKDTPLLSAHVIQIIANMDHGVAARSLETIGIQSKTLQAAARDELGN